MPLVALVEVMACPFQLREIQTETLPGHDIVGVTPGLNFPTEVTRTMRLLSTFALLAALCAPAAFAQTAAPARPAAPTCKGVEVVVRLSEITPDGSPEKFMAAVAAHQEWYKSHGFKKNQIVVAQIEEQDPVTKAWNYSTKRYLTYHINSPTGAVHDAAWDAYVKLYSETSKILETYVTCMPETVFTTDPAPWMKM